MLGTKTITINQLLRIVPTINQRVLNNSILIQPGLDELNRISDITLHIGSYKYILKIGEFDYRHTIDSLVLILGVVRDSGLPYHIPNRSIKISRSDGTTINFNTNIKYNDLILEAKLPDMNIVERIIHHFKSS